jgi:hypothetical protein
VTRGAAALTSLLVSVGRPGWWALALSTFLIRGGVVLFVLSIVDVPSPLALSNAVAPIVVPLAFGRLDGGVVLAAALSAVMLFSWLVFAGWLAAVLEVALLRDVAVAAIDEGVAGDDTYSPGSPTARALRDSAGQPGVDRPRLLDVAGGVLGARLVLMLPVVAVVGVGAVRAITVTYAELTNPTDVSRSLPIRVALGAAPELSLIAVTWLVSELLAGLAARRIALDGLGVRAAIRSSIVAAVRRPLSEVVLWLVASAALGGGLALLLASSRTTWDLLQRTLAESQGDGLAGAALILAFVAVWLTALGLGGVLSAVRTSIGVFQHGALQGARAIASGGAGASDPGTFGASAHRRPGDWSAGGEGGSL